MNKRVAAILLLLALLTGVVVVQAQGLSVQQALAEIVRDLGARLGQTVPAEQVNYSFEIQTYPNTLLGCDLAANYGLVAEPVEVFGYRMNVTYQGISYDYRIGIAGEQLVIVPCNSDLLAVAGPTPNAPPPAADADPDGDSILTELDNCPLLAGVASAAPGANGCPATADGSASTDADGDRTIALYDLCPDLPGPAYNRGCPGLASPGPIDSDDDGIRNLSDECPLFSGPQAATSGMNGCPADTPEMAQDTDLDGTLNRFDLCPTQGGEVYNRGCPAAYPETTTTGAVLASLDSDGDGIANASDLCPFIFGLPDDNPGAAGPNEHGCPQQLGDSTVNDADQDGEVNAFDLCPLEAGPAGNRGCPAVVADVSGVCTLGPGLSGYANVRDTPSIEAAQTGRVEQGMRYVVAARNRDSSWFQFELGWASATVITLNGDCTGLIVSETAGGRQPDVTVTPGAPGAAAPTATPPPAAALPTVTPLSPPPAGATTIPLTPSGTGITALNAADLAVVGQIAPASGLLAFTWLADDPATPADETRLITVGPAGLDVYLYPDTRPEATLDSITAGTLLASAPLGGLVAIGGSDSSITLLNLDSGTRTVLQDGPASALNGLAFSSGGLLAATSGPQDAPGDDMALRLWDVTLLNEDGSGGFDTSIPYQSSVQGAAFSPDGTLIAVLDLSQLEIREVNALAAVSASRPLSQGVFAAAPVFMPAPAEGTATPRRIVAYPDGTDVRLFDLDASSENTLIGTPGFIVRGLAFSPDGGLLAVVAQSGPPEFTGLLRLYDVTTGQAVFSDSLPLAGSDGGTFAPGVAFSPDGVVLSLLTPEGVRFYGVR